MHTVSTENRKQIDSILEENAKDVASVMCLSMTKEERKELNDRWKVRLAKMRKIDPLFCHYSGFKMYD
jgi:siroheme synthase (precorrin-2 oxidase/ferrochelatase)